MTNVLVYLLQALYEAVDTGNCSARMFFAAYSNGFDMIDHTVLVEELRNMHVHPVLIHWIIVFLCNRTRAVRIESFTSERKTPKGVYHREPCWESSCLRS